MNIEIFETGEIIEDALQIVRKEEINLSKRLFYQLNNPADGGKYKEIKDVSNFLEKDERLSDLNYIRHHNFLTEKC